MKAALPAIAFFLATPAVPEVVSSAEHGFALSRSAIVKASPEQVYAALGKIGGWWSPDHTYSGDARNMTIMLKPGGCFCERVPNGQGRIEHGRVIYAQPGQVLRLSAALGPLQGEGVSGALTWSLKPVEGGTEITKTYVVGGYIRGGAAAFAPIVDRVLGEQFTRLQAFVAR